MIDEVEDFLERQGEIVRALAEAVHAETVYAEALGEPDFPPSLLLKALDAMMLRDDANKLVAEYEQAQDAGILNVCSPG